MIDSRRYSDTPLIKKLGYNKDKSILLINSPDWFRDLLNESSIPATTSLPATWAHVFCDTQNELFRFLNYADLDSIEKGVWFSWPKKSSGVETDLTEQTFRDAVLPIGWVDVKVAAIDETWSALKFLRRRI
jgi:hypothetical protein